MLPDAQFEKWSRDWKTAREIDDTQQVLYLWSKPIPTVWERKEWNGAIDSYRKRRNTAGEQQIEAQLFKRESKGFELSFPGDKSTPNYSVKAIYHNMPFTNRRRGQVIADAFGVLGNRKGCRLVCIEVKVTANDPWYAAVENLQQIRLARACAYRLQDFVHGKSTYRVERGIWGLVLAPERYYEKNAGSFTKCKDLLGKLKRSTQARMAFAVSDFLSDGKIKILAHNWPVRL